jgi:hypothetical protein
MKGKEQAEHKHRTITEILEITNGSKSSRILAAIIVEVCKKNQTIPEVITNIMIKEETCLKKMQYLVGIKNIELS